ncbi:hypothetical protein ACGFX4_29135 [Kitasatospora sp. NPDC048365]|uniref:hypothetical protein n=1 Tax=Kitasatospora sp. NPDC048365 TaxID=3364050 RepID=UPI0037157563
MPGQAKRKRRQEQARQDRTATTCPADVEACWQVVFETQDYDDWQAYLRRIRAERTYEGESELRVDTLCGRLVHPTTYRLSVRLPGGVVAAPPAEG